MTYTETLVPSVTILNDGGQGGWIWLALICICALMILGEWK